ncbi:hypothetical protein HPB51_010705 [Rhipicephalus microplus]|uniref:CCHC-type domain-containing protein n=1 Tax=Rhipicephalus microplus TaxID=6941 RepID=A0A9J6F1X7_RHIMP|nr:hypothetical protein HPB51_010705 [Rhipicephalus microplus]
MDERQLATTLRDALSPVTNNYGPKLTSETTSASVSTPDRIRAEAYHSLEVLRSQRYNMNLLVATYVPAPDDSIRGVVYKAYTDETDHDLQAQLMKKNPDIPMVNARRLGSSKHLVITFAGHKLPATIRFRCFTLEVHPFRDRPEACFNCRKLGHRTDVCPLPGPGIRKCRRCDGEHPPPPLGEHPTCTPQCVVCLGKHPTGRRSCKLRFTPVKPNNSKKTSMSPAAPMRKEDQNQQAVDQDRSREKEARAGTEILPSLHRRAVVPVRRHPLLCQQYTTTRTPGATAHQRA